MRLGNRKTSLGSARELQDLMCWGVPLFTFPAPPHPDRRGKSFIQVHWPTCKSPQCALGRPLLEPAVAQDSGSTGCLHVWMCTRLPFLKLTPSLDRGINRLLLSLHVHLATLPRACSSLPRQCPRFYTRLPWVKLAYEVHWAHTQSTHRSFIHKAIFSRLGERAILSNLYKRQTKSEDRSTFQMKEQEKKKPSKRP